MNMTTKTIQCRIRINDNLFDLALLRGDMLHAYFLLDRLADNTFREIYFHDVCSAKKLLLRKSKDSANRIDSNIISLSGHEIDCIKELISQCYLNPYDAAWLHNDIEASFPSGDDAALYVHFDSNDNCPQQTQTPTA